ncbi:MAG: serine protease [Candidatus Omnitrophica bacterium]|nr:serine protease [Candidatus Omnitrophota bacterium]
MIIDVWPVQIVGSRKTVSVLFGRAPFSRWNGCRARMAHRPAHRIWTNWFMQAGCAMWILMQPVTIPAVIFMGTADPTYHTTAPTDSLTGSGWQYEGQLGQFLGTPIAPQYFITAKHITSSLITSGLAFAFDSANYTTTARYDSPDSDLTIWKVDGTFSQFAPLYTGNNEVGKSLVVIGRGTLRAGEVVVDGKAKGWYWGVGDGVQRWGENTVSSIVIASNATVNLGEMLRANFDYGAGTDEAQLSSGDSGGAVFIQDSSDSTWKLAGINYGVSGPYNLESGDGMPFNAALYDQSGLYINGDAVSGPGALYATRISSNLDWIQSVLIPEPGAWGLAFGVALLGFALVRRRRGARE